MELLNNQDLEPHSQFKVYTISHVFGKTDEWVKHSTILDSV